MKKLSYIILTLLCAASLSFAKNVKLGSSVVGDGKTLNTEAIQKAIDECSESGGGDVIFPDKSGVYLSGTLILKSNVHLYIPSNITIKLDVTATTKRAFIWAENVENVGLYGGGIIYGSGEDYEVGEKVSNRAHLARFTKCKNVKIRDVKLYASGAWTLNLVHCDTVFIDGIHLRSLVNHNHDGIDIDSKNVIISNSVIDAGDDGICLKSEFTDNHIVENIVVTNCIVSSSCNFIKFGTGSKGGFKNITISNCVLKRCTERNVPFLDWRRLKNMGIEQEITGISGIALEAVDGGFIDQVCITNIAMVDVQTPIFIRVGHRNKTEKQSYAKNIVISGITATSQSWIANSITAVEGHVLKNVTIRDCYLNAKACTDVELVKDMMSKPVTENVKGYPENRMFGCPLPAYGFFIRRAQNLTLDNVQVGYWGGDDTRPAFFCEGSNGVRIMNCVWQKPKGGAEGIVWKGEGKLYQFNNTEVDSAFLE